MMPSFPAARTRRAQRGLSLTSMLLWAVLIGLATVLAMKVYPSVQKYITTRQALDRVMHAEPAPRSVPEIRTAFERQRDIEYVQDMIRGADLDIEAVGAGFSAGFDYDDEIAIAGPVYLLIKYNYATASR